MAERVMHPGPQFTPLACGGAFLRFLCDDVTVTEAREKGHMHIADFVAHAHRFQVRPRKAASTPLFWCCLGSTEVRVRVTVF